MGIRAPQFLNALRFSNFKLSLDISEHAYLSHFQCSQELVQLLLWGILKKWDKYEGNRSIKKPEKKSVFLQN